MQLFPSIDETIAGVGQSLKEGRRTCVDVLESCLAKINERESEVHAWVVVDREGAREQATQLDRELAQGTSRGPLHGIPIGIKDIIDVQGLPSGRGSRLWADLIAETDADLVAQLRQAGAVILGKTVTTPYAWIDPPVTRNPWDLNRTPGGSSSGSAAAVACGMCLGAIGTQTGGSITRPASFCGVAGFKPSHGRISTRGVLPFAPSLDHPGPIARCVGDLELFHSCFDSVGPTVSRRRWERAPWRERDSGGREIPRLGRLGGSFHERASPAMRDAVDEAVAAFMLAGARVHAVALPPGFERAHALHRTIMAAEAAAYHAERLSEEPDDYPKEIRELLNEGLMISATNYINCREPTSMLAHQFATIFDQFDVLVTPAALGPAPDPGTTGNPTFNSPWSLLGLPTITFPIARSPEGLPLGIQLIGRKYGDVDLLSDALWCEDVARRAYYSQE